MLPHLHGSVAGVWQRVLLGLWRLLRLLLWQSVVLPPLFIFQLPSVLRLLLRWPQLLVDLMMDMLLLL